MPKKLPYAAVGDDEILKALQETNDPLFKIACDLHVSYKRVRLLANEINRPSIKPGRRAREAGRNPEMDDGGVSPLKWDGWCKVHGRCCTPCVKCVLEGTKKVPLHRPTRNSQIIG